MISCQKHEISPEQIFNGESNLPAITAISQEILNQPYCVPRKSGKKKKPGLYAERAVVTAFRVTWRFGKDFPGKGYL